MNWSARIQNVYQTLRMNGQNDLIDQMISDYGVGGTPGEQFSIVCVWLAKMRNNQQNVFELVKDDANAILKEGITLEYFTEAYYKSL